MHSEDTPRPTPGVSRRRFMRSVAAGGVGLALLPRVTHADDAQTPTTAPAGRKLRIASVGVKGKGESDIESFQSHPSVVIVALCDVDAKSLAAAAKKYPNARTYGDWREMLAKEAGNVDAVSVSIPDHMHAPVAMTAIRLGKHVYVQKPLTHDIYEARQLQAAAKQYNVVTQMGIQHHSSVALRSAAQVVSDGVIGKVKEVHQWTNRPIWPQGSKVPPASEPVPPELNWDHWIGTAPMHAYVPKTFHPFAWRGVFDFGTGAMGDMGCHIIDLPFTALKLGPLIAVMAETAEPNDERYPAWEIIHFEFPGNDLTAGSTLPLTWYDGGKLPDESLFPPEIRSQLAKARKENEAKDPKEKSSARKVIDHVLGSDSGTLFVGEKGVVLAPLGGGPRLFPEETFASFKRPKLTGIDHYHLWVDACLGNATTNASFDHASPLTEVALLGSIASRCPNQRLEWNSAEMKITNFAPANDLVRRKYRQGWEVEGLS